MTEKSLHIYGREVGNINLKEVLDVSIIGGSSPLSLSMEELLSLPDTDVAANKFDVLGPNETKTYNFGIGFDSSAGNSYQGKTLVFDITFGVKSGQVLSAATEDGEGGDILGVLDKLPITGSNIALFSLGLIIAGFILNRLKNRPENIATKEISSSFLRLNNLAGHL